MVLASDRSFAASSQKRRVGVVLYSQAEELERTDKTFISSPFVRVIWKICGAAADAIYKTQFRNLEWAN